MEQPKDCDWSIRRCRGSRAAARSVVGGEIAVSAPPQSPNTGRVADVIERNDISWTSSINLLANRFRSM